MKKSIKKVFENKTEWYNEQGQLHREDGPAVELANGYKAWYLNGQRHREGRPAVEHADGTKTWYINGQRHRKDGPAVEWANGTKKWYLNDRLHREDGPAVELVNGDKYWYLKGHLLSKKEFNRKTRKTKSKMIEISGKKSVLILLKQLLKNILNKKL